MLNVFFTVDVEVWPTSWWDLDPKRFKGDFQRYIYGTTKFGDYGLPFQLKLLKEHDLKAVFFVEALFASEFGPEWLKEIIDLIKDAGQEVQMHIHPEWIGRMTHSILPGKKARRMLDYSLQDQTFIIAKGKQNLQEAGLDDIQAFRAGGYGANTDTLIALANNGITFDTSYNPCILGDISGIAGNDCLFQPKKINGVYEFPVSVFEDWPGHLRHLQLGACSFSELTHGLRRAEKSGYENVVIVSHGFELLNKSKDRIDPIVVNRFERFLGFLAANRDAYRTCCFSEFEAESIPSSSVSLPIKSNLIRTLWRYFEQATRRIYQ